MIYIWQRLKFTKKRIALIFLFFLFCTASIACGKNKLSVNQQADEILNRYYVRGDIDTAIKKTKELLDHVKQKKGDNEKDTVIVLLNLGLYYISLEEYEEADQYLQEAKKISDEMGLNEWPIGEVYYQLSLVEAGKNNHEKAIEYKKEAISWKEKEHGKDSWQVGTVYFGMGTSYIEMDRLEEAEVCILKSLEATYEGALKMAYVTGYYSLGEIKIKQQKYEEAVEMFNVAKTNYHKIYGDKSTISLELTALVPIYSKLADAYVGLHEYEQALDAIIQGYSYIGRAPSSIEFITERVEEYKTKMFEIWKVVNDSESRTEFESWLFNDVAY